MLPPEIVPPGLSYHEYLQLNLRYLSLGWVRQSMSAMHFATLNQPDTGEVSAESKKRALALFDAAEKVLFVQEISDDVKKSISGLVDYTMDKVDKKLDRFQSVKKAKDGLKTVFGLVSQSVQETIDGSLEHHVLPALGMSLENLPEGKSSEEYMQLAARYIQIGASEPARDCLSRIISLEPQSAIADLAKKLIKTQLPRQRVPHDAMVRYMSALRHSLLREEEKARALLVELEVKYPRYELPMVQLAMLEIKNKQLDRCRHLLEYVLKLNPDLLKAWSAKGRLAIAEWRLSEMDECLDKMTALYAEDQSTQALKQMQTFINNAGLRASSV